MSFHIIPSVNIIIIKGSKILLSRRKNTGWMDKQLCIPGGHVETGEMPKEAAIRELKEELDMTVTVDDLEYLCTVARNKDPESYVAYEFIIRDKELRFKNAEPEKCSELVWVDMNNLPDDVIPIFRDIIIDCVLGDKKYLERTY